MYNTQMRKLILLISICLLAASCGGKASVKDAPPQAQEAFAEGNRLIDKERFEEARQVFRDARNAEGAEEYAPLAQLRIADSYGLEDSRVLAIEEYGRFMDEYPSHKYAPYAQYRIAKLYFEDIVGPDRGYGAAVQCMDAVSSLNKRYPRHPYRQEAEQMARIASDTIAEHEFLVGDFYFKRNACYGTMERLEGLLKDFPSYWRRPEVLYRLAVCYQLKDQGDKAQDTLKTLEAEYPVSGLAAQARHEAETRKTQK